MFLSFIRKQNETDAFDSFTFTEDATLKIQHLKINIGIPYGFLPLLDLNIFSEYKWKLEFYNNEKLHVP